MITQRDQFYSYYAQRINEETFYDSSIKVEDPSEPYIKMFMRSNSGEKIAIGENIVRQQGTVTAQVFTPKGNYSKHLLLVNKVYQVFKDYSVTGRLRMENVSVTDLGDDPETPTVYSNVTAIWFIDE